jgi:hypothetical protein
MCFSYQNHDDDDEDDDGGTEVETHQEESDDLAVGHFKTCCSLPSTLWQNEPFQALYDIYT